MSTVVSPKNLGVYRNILALIWKHGNRQALETLGLTRLPEFLLPSDSDTRPGPGDLADDLEKLGPTYIKIGQVLSAQLNVLPPEYMEAMSRLQDDVKPTPFDELVPVIEAGIGEPFRSVFRDVDTGPLGSASLGQVYRAELLDGTAVAIKVQRPGAAERVAEDFDALMHVARTLDGLTRSRYALESMCEHTRQQIEAELDYTREATNLATMRRLMRDEPRVRVPRPYRSLCSKQVLVMDFMPGERLTDLSPRRIDELDGDDLANRLFKKYLDHILVEGFFHADPHPGNVLVDDENRILLLDLGMAGRIAPQLRADLTQLVLAIVDGRGEDVADLAIGIGSPQAGFSRDAFRRAISDLVLVHYNHSIDAMNIGDVVLQIAQKCGEHRVNIPPILSTVGKALLNLDQLGQVLSPGFNPRDAIQQHTSPILWQDLLKAISPVTYAGQAFEVRRLVQQLPRQFGSVLDTLAREDKGFKIDAIDERELINGFEKIANRITYGLIIAALFISGAMIMNIDSTTWRLGGIPWLSWLLFLAGGFGIVLVLGGIALFKGTKKPSPNN